jgi:hypothetical protein
MNHHTLPFIIIVRNTASLQQISIISNIVKDHLLQEIVIIERGIISCHSRELKTLTSTSRYNMAQPIGVHEKTFNTCIDRCQYILT